MSRPVLGILSTDPTGSLLQRLLRSLSASDPDATPVVYQPTAPEQSGASVLAALPPWIGSRARLLMDTGELKAFSRAYVLRHLLPPTGGALLLDERLVAVQSVLAGISVPEDQVVLFSSGIDTRKDGRSPVSDLAIGWGSQQADLLENWCEAEEVGFRAVLQGDPPSRATWLERNLHLPQVDLLPASLVFSPRADAIEREGGLQAARLVDLRPAVVDQPWLLGADLPTDADLLTALRGFVDRHADILRDGPEETRGPEDVIARECHAGLRAQYRIETGLWLTGKLEEPPVAEDFGDPELGDWLAEPPAESASPCSRYALWPWHRRPDLRAAFPDPVGENSRAYLAWCKSRGVIEVGLDPAQLHASRRQPARTRPHAVNVAAYAGAILGVGESGRRVSRACRAAGYEVIDYPARETANRQTFVSQGHDRGATTIAVINPDRLPAWWESVGRNRLSSTRRIGLWAWEVNAAPPGLDEAAALLDEVWAISTYTADCLRPHLGRTPWVFPHPVSQEALPAGRSPLAGTAYFLVVLDYHSVLARKNPWGAIDAFQMAFPDGSGPTLVIKTINEKAAPVEAAKLHWYASSRQDVVVVDKYLDEPDMRALVEKSLAVVSLHRAEGFGLVLADAMSMGVPVIATGYSGNLDFMTEANSLLVDYTLVPVGKGNEPYAEEAEWADPRLDTAAEHLLRIYEDETFRRVLGMTAQETICETHSLERASRMISERLEAGGAVRGRSLRKRSSLLRSRGHRSAARS